MAKRKQEFFIRTGKGWVKQEGYLVVIEGTEFFIHKTDRKADKWVPWVVTHGRSGMKVLNHRTKREATAALQRIVSQYGIDYINRVADRAISEIGEVSPRYSA